MHKNFAFALPFVLLSALLAPRSFAADKKLDPEHARKMAEGLALFKSQVRPVLVQSCLNCHGGEKTRAEFDLSTRESLLRGGSEGKSIVIGNHAKSALWEMVAHKREPFMPHKRKKLPDTAIAAIGKWIDLGAPYDASLLAKSEDGKGTTAGEMVVTKDHRKWWAFLPLADVQVPAAGEGWSKNPVDRFTLASLRDRGLVPSEPADARTLVRRVYLDLIGLPPPIDVVEKFVKDPSPENYSRIVDDLLASERHGERWARYWLDVSRFAESHGFEHDYDRRHAYHFRDFVIRALNEDMPYDQFVRWQLAGDEFAPDDPMAVMATGFLGAGVFPTQITKNEVERTRYDALDDMAATTGTAFLGLTIGCARCHDHKFDPIPTRDYYRFVSTFTTTVRSEIDFPVGGAEYREALAEHQKKAAVIDAELAKLEKENLPDRLVDWLSKRKPEDKPRPAWHILDVDKAVSRGGAKLTKQPDGSLLASGKNPATEKFTIEAKTDLRKITALRLEALSHPSFVRGGPGRASNGNIGLSRIRLYAEPLQGENRKRVEVALSSPVASFQQNSGVLSIASSLKDNPKAGWAVDPQFGKDHAAVFQIGGSVGFEGGTKLTIELLFEVNTAHTIGRPRLSVSDLPRPVGLEGRSVPGEITASLAAIDQAAGKTVAEKLATLSDEKRSALTNWYARIDSEWLAIDARRRDLESKKPKAEKVRIQVTTEGHKPMRHHSQGRDFFDKTYLLDRGDTDQKREVVSQSFLEVLMRGGHAESKWIEAPKTGSRTSYRRRSLANWITDVENGSGHLLARVIVNRLWQHHFGRGIVATANDFGTQGDRPSHPLLLDWLARELIKNGWRLKPIHKLLVTSATYRQASGFDEGKSSIDPTNQWLWRYSPRRLEAEAIRDSMLSVSESLDVSMFGPGTLDENMKRRSVYFTVKRSRMIPTMQLFDAPEPLDSVGDRPTTTTAPQALHFMNSRQVREYAKSFAKGLAPHARNGLPTAAVIGYLKTVSRAPTPRELERSVKFLEAQTKRYTEEKKANAKDLALVDFCQVLFSLNEFIYAY